MPYKPVNYGNILAQTEAIKSQRFNNSLAQQRANESSELHRAKIEKLQREAQNPQSGIDPTAPMRNYQERQRLIANGATPEQLATFDNYVRAQQMRKLGGVETIVGPGGYGNRPLSNLQDEAAAEAYQEYMKNQGTLRSQMGDGMDLPEKTFDLGGYNAPAIKPASAAEVAGAETKAKEEAKIQVASSDPLNVAKERRILADNLGVQETIADLLSKGDDGKSIVSYAYGKKTLLPDWLKTEDMHDSEALRNRVVASVQLENVKKLKGTGPITENEQKILADAASVLKNPLISAQLAEKELRRVDLMFKSWARENEAAIARGELDPNWNKQTDNDPLGIR